MGDIDGDAIPDIVLASRNGPSLAWTKNLGGGEFGPDMPIASQGSICAVLLVDLDMDGDLDILCGAGYGWVFWFANDGTGVFGPVHHILQQSSPEGVNIAVSDLDGDSDPDVVYAAESTGTSGYFLNDGAGNFSTAAVLAPVTAGAYQVSAGDLDGDNDQDLLISGSTNLVWYENAGNGTFASTHLVYSGPLTYQTTLIADIDGDQDMDIVGSTYGSVTSYKRLLYHLNTGGGTFAAASIIRSSYLVGDFQGVLEAVDMDGDQDPDLLVFAEPGIGGDELVEWYENPGNGLFPTSPAFTLPQSAYYISGCDIDGDGDLDLATTRNDVKVETWLNDGSGSFSFHGTAMSIYDQAWTVDVEDLGDDGDLDVLVGETNFNTLDWAVNCSGSYDTVLYVNTYDASSLVYTMLEDVDGDGKRDIVVRLAGLNGIYWMRNLGGGEYAPRVFLVSATGDGKIYFTDWSGDGYKDLIVDDKYPAPERVRLHLGNGSGTFGAAYYLTSPTTGLSYPFISDMDGDGDPDLVTRVFTDTVIQWRENVSGGPTHAISNGTADILTVIVDDLDGDGDDDVAYATTATGNVVWKRNDGSGSFGPEEQLFVPDTLVRRIRAVDLDANGGLDLLLQYPQRIAWARGLGGGLFDAPVVLLDSANTSRRMDTADMDGDGDQDLIYGWLTGTHPLVWSANELPVSLATQNAPASPSTVIHCAPVPFKDHTVLRCDTPFETGTRLYIRDGLGRTVREQMVSGASAVSIARNGLISGLYTITVAGQNALPRTIRVVVE